MIAQFLSFVLVTGSMGLMLNALVQNQLDPSYGSALAIPFVNLASLVIALVGLGLGIAAYTRNRQAKWAKRAMLLGLACSLVLALMIPFAELGHLSRIR